MSRVNQSKPLPFDPVAEAQEAERREFHANNEPLQRGMAAARAQELSNARGALEQALADLKRVSVNKDVNTPGRDSYNRTHNRVVKAAERVAEITGEGIAIPAWVAPPVLTQAETVTVGPRKTDGAYRETRGMGPSGAGLPLTGPGSNTDPNWLSTGSKK